MGPGMRDPQIPDHGKERQKLTYGAECSIPAVKQRVQKLRRDAENSPSSADGNGATAPGASPAGAQKPKSAGGAGRKGGKKAKQAKGDTEVDAAEADGEKDDEE